VTVTSNGGINATGGLFAMGIWAGSMGGTGGAGGATDSAEGAWGGAGGAGGLGGPVTVANYGDIQTGGLFSVGILAASPGGNGGAGARPTRCRAYGGKVEPGRWHHGTNNDGTIRRRYTLSASTHQAQAAVAVLADRPTLFSTPRAVTAVLEAAAAAWGSRTMATSRPPALWLPE
jgi:hypothetical protein